VVSLAFFVAQPWPGTADRVVNHTAKFFHPGSCGQNDNSFATEAYSFANGMNILLPRISSNAINDLADFASGRG
jgi:hypothetical protein